MSGEKTFQEAFYLEEAGLAQRLWRNVRLFGYILEVIWSWAIVGSRVRSGHRRAKREGRPYYIDDLAERGY